MTINDLGEFSAYVDGRRIGSELATSSGLGVGYLGFAAADRNGTRFHDDLSPVGIYSHHLSGRIDETRIYNRSLSEQEIRAVSKA